MTGLWIALGLVAALFVCFVLVLLLGLTQAMKRDLPYDDRSDLL